MYSIGKKNARAKKTRDFFKSALGLQFLTKTDQIFTANLCYVYFKNTIFGSFIISTKMSINTVSLVQNYVFKIFTKYLIK
jgi:hypothetical protein